MVGPRAARAARGDYARDGAVILRGAVPPEALKQLAAAVEAVESRPGPLFIEMRPEGETGGSRRFWEDFRRWRDVPELVSGLCAAHLGDAAAELLGVRQVRLFHDHILVKEAASPLETPLHQDLPYYPVNGTTTVSFWIPLDDVPRSSALEFVRGSHRGKMFMPRSFKGGRPLVFQDTGELPEVPVLENDGVDEENGDQIIGWEAHPGDAIVFNMLTLHRAGPTTGLAHARRAVSFRFVAVEGEGGDVIYAPRPKRTSPPYPEFEERGVLSGISLSIMPDVFPVASSGKHPRDSHARFPPGGRE
jgi:ectoine hydroxylase-related dioxygenase (phytanoyl-CoA dioxygenase family)